MTFQDFIKLKKGDSVYVHAGHTVGEGEVLGFEVFRTMHSECEMPDHLPPHLNPDDYYSVRLIVQMEDAFYQVQPWHQGRPLFVWERDVVGKVDP